MDFPHLFRFSELMKAIETKEKASQHTSFVWLYIFIEKTYPRNCHNKRFAISLTTCISIYRNVIDGIDYYKM